MRNSPNPDVGLIMGSETDWERSVIHASDVLLAHSIPQELDVVSAHRTPDEVPIYAAQTQAKIIIACAGGAAHLPGMTAAATTKPVIGLPGKTSTLRGLDSLLSIMPMPPGVPVGTVGRSGERSAKHAAHFAMRVLDATKMQQSAIPARPSVAVLADETSKVSVADGIATTFGELGMPDAFTLHRGPRDALLSRAREATAQGIRVIILLPGDDDAAPGKVAAETPLPVVTVPRADAASVVYAITMLDSLTDTPEAVPVVTMAMDGGANGALYTAQILALCHSGVTERLQQHRVDMRRKVAGMRERISAL